MPTLADHRARKPVKLLNVGDSGTGKTGAIASLIDAGYKVRILDFDNGLDVLPFHVKDKNKLSNVNYLTITEQMQMSQFGPVPKNLAPKAFSRGMKMLDHWKYTDKDTGEVVDFGPITKWDDDCILVIDSLTMMSTAALYWARGISSSLTQKYVRQDDWQLAMNAIEGMLGMLYEEEVRCNVILKSHLVPIGEDENEKFFPSTLGKKLPPKVGRYFNTMVLTKAIGTGQSVKRVIRTVPESKVACKVPVQGLKEELPISNGLLTIFKAVKGE